MDGFLVEHQLWKLNKGIEDNRSERLLYQSGNDEKMLDLTTRMIDLEGAEEQTSGSINSIRSLLESLQNGLATASREITGLRLINIKQDLVIRTMHNLTSFDGYGMFTDTFVNGDNIDWNKSIRAEMMQDLQAVGKTRKSVVTIKQTTVSSSMMISKNGSSDEAFTQSFIMDKTRNMDRVSLHISTYSNQTYQPLRVFITDALGGGPITERTIQSTEVLDKWIDIDLPEIRLEGNKEYFIVVETQDRYGYKIGLDISDNYLPGTSFSKYSGVWTDNNFDIGFKVWCLPSDDENDATIYTNPKKFETVPKTIVFDAEQVGGSINYHVSRDNGSTWKILQPGIETNLNDLPTGSTLVIKAYIVGESRINAWGYVVTRSDTK
ncbi:hypothetical protein ACK8P5_25615 (plasmid) [Paenibacillus sp. EC2-1]|uniref:hypothetical protein n=1 Tax=Paenibacillus sp. EC2-1 TaxID=3388665 RepID=UPI003BEF190D